MFSEAFPSSLEVLARMVYQRKVARRTGIRTVVGNSHRQDANFSSDCYTVTCREVGLLK